MTTVKTYRCYNCDGPKGLPGRDFEAAAPTCPACGVDGTVPRFAGLVAALEVVHFDAPSVVRNVGVGYRACDPAKRLPAGDGMDAGPRFSGHPAAVTCPGCKASAAFLEATADSEGG